MFTGGGDIAAAGFFKEDRKVAYRFRGKFSGTIFRMDARQRLYRKERRIQSARRRTPQDAIESPEQGNLAGDAMKMLGDVLRNPQVQQAALQLLPRLLGLPKPPALPMLPPPRG